MVQPRLLGIVVLVMLGAALLMIAGCATPAHAAWIGWTHATFPSAGIDRWTPGGAVDTLDECKLASLTAAENSIRRFRARDNGTVHVRTGAVIETTFADGARAAFAMVCLPDTLDPRQ